MFDVKQTRVNFEQKLVDAYKEAIVEMRKNRAMPKDMGITGSTFRAYRNCHGRRPSEVYKEWAKSSGMAIVSGGSIESRKQFTDLHSSLASSFSDSWKNAGNRSLLVSEKFKVVDLFVKALAFRSQHNCEEQRNGLFRFANIPLDKFSLLALTDLFVGVVISKAPSMGDIRDIETYEYLQDFIYDATRSLGLPNLVFDFYAWDAFHSPQD